MQTTCGVADDGVVLVVDPRLVREPLTVRALDGGHGALTYGSSPSLEALEHGVDVELGLDDRHLTRKTGQSEGWCSALVRRPDTMVHRSRRCR